MDCKAFCRKRYGEIFKEEYRNAEGKPNDKRRLAQKNTIRKTTIEAFRKFPAIEPAEVWKTIYIAHIRKHSGVDDLTLVQNVMSAENSWKKSSGHAFEQIICDLLNPILKPHDMKFILQKELSNKIKLNEISNEVRDVSWLKEQAKGSVFDLFSVITERTGDNVRVFGCIQSKTSIRDRVTRDREPSRNAMAAFFWSVSIVLDGAFLKLPKFRSMVNGGSSEFRENGWHSLYCFSKRPKKENRIFYVDVDFKVIEKHAVKAKNAWLKKRQWFNSDWRPE